MSGCSRPSCCCCWRWRASQSGPQNKVCPTSVMRRRAQDVQWETRTSKNVSSNFQSLGFTYTFSWWHWYHTVNSGTRVDNTPFTRSSKHRANIKLAWWNPASWLKCRPRLSPQLITCYIGLPITNRPPS